MIGLGVDRHRREIVKLHHATANSFRVPRLHKAYRTCMWASEKPTLGLQGRLAVKGPRKTVTVSDFGRPPQIPRKIAPQRPKTTQCVAWRATNGVVICNRSLPPAVAIYSASNGLVVPLDERATRAREGDFR